MDDCKPLCDGAYVPSLFAVNEERAAAATPPAGRCSLIRCENEREDETLLRV